ncbi:SPOR domain-containing protein [Marivirga harenae]|uniref:SPOR domain-containing protein n=1 Tax=Marivirga harenae TaxID=2010992 RepID=UPI0026DF99AF|nr:SPOR domain-containing protein [Marivirga harenae]WKV13712.1 SPOR domain-containing protein [Marivirga harenae]|tara:strand:+ start:85396 stop:85905 length:510 start_codon:yes stop_codon:yes gene_type:complete
MNKFGFGIAFLLLGFFIVGCITSQPTSTASKSYSEDLSQYRPTVDTAFEMESEKSSFRSTSENFEANADVTALLDKKLDTLAENNKEIRYVNGYAIQIYSGSSSAEAYEARDTARVVLPEIRTDVEYKQPIYKVRVGRFTERLEVQRTLLKLKPKFPDAISVPQRIYIN